MTFVFVGSAPSHMMGVFSATEFGQRLELTEKQAAEAATGGCAIAPAPEFGAIFTADDQALLKRHASFGAHAGASLEFEEKRKAALVAAAEFATCCAVQEGK